VRLDDVAQLRVAVEERERDLGVGPGAAQAALVVEEALLLRVHELRHVHVGRDLVVRVQPRHLGVDELGPPFARQGDAVVAVLDEVRAADLEHADGGQAARVGELAQPLQPAAREPAARLELAVEVLAPVHRPDDPLDRDPAHAEVGAARDREPPARLVERQQVGAWHASDPTPGRCARPSARGAARPAGGRRPP
jgi:hypothetical protein